jgi:hypothetical protein
MNVLLKLPLAVVAALLTNSVTQNLPDNLPADPQIDHPDLKGANRQTWETFRIFYHSLHAALQNDDPTNGWPAPPVGNLLGLLSGQGPVGQFLAELLTGLFRRDPSSGSNKLS